MKTYAKILCAVAAASMLAPAALAQQTKVLTADKHNEYGLVYCLPITSLQVEVGATRRVSKAGPFYPYAKKYMGSDNVIKEDGEQWTIDYVRVTPYGEPDPDRQYLMQLKSGALTYIGVDADGMLLSINREPAEPVVPAKNDTKPAQNKYTGKEYLEYVNEDFLASQSSAKRAQMLAESLMEIRDAKISLTRGTAETMPADGRQLELMLNSLQEQERALSNAFTGTTEETQVVRTFTYTPDEAGRAILFRMSDFAGFVDAEDLSGDPVYISVEPVGTVSLPTDANGEEKKLPKDAVMYALPGTAEVSISFLGKPLYTKQLMFAQFGTEFGLNPTLFSDRKNPSYAIFDPVTGALKEIGATTWNNQ